MTVLLEPQRLPVWAVIQCAMDIEAAPFLAYLTDISTQVVIGGAAFNSSSSEELGAEESASLEETPTKNGRQTFRLGTWKGRPVLVVTSGIGLANSASATARALMMVDPQVVIAAGTAGGLATSVNVGDVVIATSAVFNAADATAFGYVRGQVPGMPPVFRTSLALEALAQRVILHHSHASTEEQDAINTSTGSTHTAGTYAFLSGEAISGDSFVTAVNVGTMRDDFPRALTTDMETAALAQVAWSAGVDWVMIRAVSDLCGPAADQDFHMDAEQASQHSCHAVEAFLEAMASTPAHQHE